MESVIQCKKVKDKEFIITHVSGFISTLFENKDLIGEDFFKLFSKLDNYILKKIAKSLEYGKTIHIFGYSSYFEKYLDIFVLPDKNSCWLTFSDMTKLIQKTTNVNKAKFFQDIELELLSSFLDPENLIDVYSSIATGILKIPEVEGVGIYQISKNEIKKLYETSTNFLNSEIKHDLIQVYRLKKYRIFNKFGKSYLVYPILHTDFVGELILIASFTSNVFDEYMLEFLRELEVAISITSDRLKLRNEIAQKNKHLEMVIEDILKVMSKLVELRDPYTAGHQKNVAKLSVEIGKELGFDNEELKILRYAALVHDIGKIGVPLEILVKPSSLSVLELNLIREHPRIGYELLSNLIPPFEKISKIVFQHHERCDGSGYPLALNCQEILLESKIIAVADTVDAMMSHRPYRPSLGFEKALEEIKINKGIKYDEMVVDACINVFEKDFKF
ncbi:HD-GYP domain-containing protein [Thermosipho globiformans]|uniref:HD-GYP domain-containing protein n=1 Tax=Thermosipho globiformans TaxID=380685 RepID=UPI000F8C7461|nr:HD-GYP domain-containing protein [Thermosipho globiformans]